MGRRTHSTPQALACSAPHWATGQTAAKGGESGTGASASSAGLIHQWAPRQPSFKRGQHCLASRMGGLDGVLLRQWIDHLQVEIHGIVLRSGWRQALVDVGCPDVLGPIRQEVPSVCYDECGGPVSADGHRDPVVVAIYRVTRRENLPLAPDRTRPGEHVGRPGYLAEGIVSSDQGGGPCCHWRWARGLPLARGGTPPAVRPRRAGRCGGAFCVSGISGGGDSPSASSYGGCLRCFEPVQPGSSLQPSKDVLRLRK